MTKEDIKQICQIYDNLRRERDAATIVYNSEDTFWSHILATYDFIMKQQEVKQKEQKPAEWSKNDTVFLNEITDFFENKTVRLQHDLDMYAHWLKSLPERFNPQPKQEWSEEDERKYQCIRNILLTDMGKKVGSWKYSEILEWYEKRGIGRYTNFKPHWKPSEEQMKWLRDVIETVPMTCRQQIPLESLYNDLKKLM